MENFIFYVVITLSCLIVRGLNKMQQGENFQHFLKWEVILSHSFIKINQIWGFFSKNLQFDPSLTIRHKRVHVYHMFSSDIIKYVIHSIKAKLIAGRNNVELQFIVGITFRLVDNFRSILQFTLYFKVVDMKNCVCLRSDSHLPKNCVLFAWLKAL